MKKLTPHYGFFTLIFFLLITISYAQVGINDTNPTTALDVNGALSLREGTALTLGTTNSDVSLGATPYSTYRITGPTANFSISSIVPVTNADGQMVVLENTTTHTMTLLHNSGTTPDNNIFIAGARNLVLSGQYATVTLVYNTTHNRWLVTNYSDNRYGDNIQSVKGTTDVSINSSTFADMPDMTITFTPNHSTVYVNFSASGFMDLTGIFRPEGSMGLFRLINVTAGSSVEAGFMTLVTDYNSDGSWETVGTGYNASLNMFPVTVTPGVSTTLKIQWARDGAFAPAALLNSVNSVPDISHRVFTIFD